MSVEVHLVLKEGDHSLKGSYYAKITFKKGLNTVVCEYNQLLMVNID